MARVERVFFPSALSSDRRRLLVDQARARRAHWRDAAAAPPATDDDVRAEVHAEEDAAAARAGSWGSGRAGATARGVVVGGLKAASLLPLYLLRKVGLTSSGQGDGMGGGGARRSEESEAEPCA